MPPPVEPRRRGLMLVLSSPSGAGKTTIARRLLANEKNLRMSVSVTTRAARPGEQAGVDYRFVKKAEFDAMVAAGELLEHARVFGNDYGTPRLPVEQALNAGDDVLFDIDWQGAQQLTESARDDVVKVFVLPPSTDELEKRLRGRAQDTAAVVDGRMAKAAAEMTHWAEYDYIVVNDRIDRAVAQVAAVLAAERLRRERYAEMSRFVSRLQSG